MYALFNSEKNFIGYSPDIPPDSNILKKEIPESRSNLNIWKWEGSYDEGKMVSILEEGFPKEQIEYEKELAQKVSKNYPYPIQMVNIIRQLKKIADNTNIQDDAFMDMAEEVLHLIDLQDKRIKYALNRKKFLNIP